MKKNIAFLMAAPLCLLLFSMTAMADEREPLPLHSTGAAAAV